MARISGKPNWEFYHSLGKSVSSQINDPVMTWREIGAEMGCSHQQAYHLAQVALEKFVYVLEKTGLLEELRQ